MSIGGTNVDIDEIAVTGNAGTLGAAPFQPHRPRTQETAVTEVAGLPPTGPITLAQVCGELGYTEGGVPARDARLTLRVDAVNSWVRSLPVASDALTYGTPPPAWPSHVTLGALMLAARLWRRKDSPSGVETFTDQGAVYVQRNDPDVAQLLRLGSYTAPLVG